MIQLREMAVMAAGRLARVAVGFLALTIIAAAFVPTCGTDDPSRPVPDDPEWRPAKVTLAVPEGQTSNTVTITDAAGRELASLTRFHDGNTSVVARPEGRPQVGLFLDQNGRTALVVEGPSCRTRFILREDGETSVQTDPRPDVPRPAGPRPATPKHEETP